MKIKILAFVGIVVLLISFAAGATGAVRLADQAGGNGTVGDRVVGVFITREYLDVSDDEMMVLIQEQIMKNDSVNEYVIDMNSTDYRIYAKRVEGSSEDPAPSFYFEGIRGVLFCSIPVTEESGNTYMHSYIGNSEEEDESKQYISIQGHFSHNVSDEGTFVTLEATVYALNKEDATLTNLIPVEESIPGLEAIEVMSESEENMYCLYTVYQTVTGELYIRKGDYVPIHPSMYRFGSGTISQAWENTVTVGGKKESDRLEVKITFEGVDAPEKYIIIEADQEHGIVKREEFVPGTLPETLVPQDKTAYIIVETYTTDPSGNPLIERRIIQPEDKTQLFTTFCVEYQTLCSMTTQIEWE